MTTSTTLKEDFYKLVKEVKESTPSNNNELTVEQLWTIVKICKYVRLRARNNTAFNNLFNFVFPYANFEQIMKQRADGSRYPGLRITHKITNKTVEDNDQET